MAEAAEPGAAEGLLVALPALMLGPGPGLQPDGQVRHVRLLLPASDWGQADQRIENHMQELAIAVGLVSLVLLTSGGGK